MPKNALCENCGKSIVSLPSDRNKEQRTKYCTPECAKVGHQRKQIEKRKQCNLQARLGLSSGIIGQINEMVVAIDLLKRGWQVYTAIESTHSFDILAVRNGRELRIEVKTETVLPSGHTIVSMKKGQKEKHDILAKVRNLSEITYKPDLPA